MNDPIRKRTIIYYTYTLTSGVLLKVYLSTFYLSTLCTQVLNPSTSFEST